MAKNMQNTKTPMPEALPEVRNKNFEEVAKGYSDADAKNEADRCLGCKNPLCVSGCPVNIDIPGFIKKVSEGDVLGGYEIIKKTSSLPAVCGRVCPQENQCEGKCVRGVKGEPVAIGRLERYCADYAMKLEDERGALGQTAQKKPEIIHSLAPEPGRTAGDAGPCGDNISVAVIGSGPSGLSCAGTLANMGYSVTVFEALHKAGGVLVYGIPEFRLPKDIVEKEISSLKKKGVRIICDTVIGRTASVDELFEMGYKAVFVGGGAGLPRFMGIPGENAVGVYSANEFLTRVNLMKAGSHGSSTPIIKSESVAVVGGGNVAMDAARCAKRLGAKNVYIIYRRSEKEMPARAEEIHHAKEEGIQFMMLTNPKEILTDKAGCIRAVKCVKMELGEPDASGRRSPVEVEGSELTLDIETAIIAVGTSPNPLIRMTTPGLDTDKRGCIITADGVTTSREGVFAGGDAVTGAATVILAMGAGRKAAHKIDEYIKSKYKGN